MIRRIPRALVATVALTGALLACSSDNRPVSGKAPPASEYDLTAAREIISTANEPAKQLFGHKSGPSAQTPAAWGSTQRVPCRWGATARNRADLAGDAP